MRAFHVPDELVRELRVYPPEIKRKIRQALDEIRTDPSGKLLEDELAGLQSRRVGRYRIVYRVMATHIDIVTIGDRETIYLEAARLVSRRRPS